MKKLLYISLVFLSFSTVSCSSDNLGTITTGVKVITKCCTEISNVAASAKCKLTETSETSESSNQNSNQLLLTNTWDTKMMIK